jgi:hypothetical protein
MQPHQHPDCLVCLNPTTQRQPTTPYCFCHPPVHRICWDNWTSFSGPVCLICRYRPPETIIVYRQERRDIIYIFHYPCNQMTLLGLGIILLYILSLFMRTFTPVGIKRSSGEL